VDGILNAGVNRRLGGVLPHSQSRYRVLSQESRRSGRFLAIDNPTGHEQDDDGHGRSDPGFDHPVKLRTKLREHHEDDDREWARFPEEDRPARDLAHDLAHRDAEGDDDGQPAVTKSMSSSTRPSSTGSRSA
ncbi:MAG: hypothetical protein ABWX59_08785, partial [Microbacteriaceae bacterium]